jgi:hypothetical protein
VPTLSGALTIALPEGVLALLRHVPGNPHWPWEWVTECLGTDAMPAEINAAARRAWQEAVAAAGDNHLTISLTHGDPGPDSFLLSNTDAGQDAPNSNQEGLATAYAGMTAGSGG